MLSLGEVAIVRHSSPLQSCCVLACAAALVVWFLVLVVQIFIAFKRFSRGLVFLSASPCHLGMFAGTFIQKVSWFDYLG